MKSRFKRHVGRVGRLAGFTFSSSATMRLCLLHALALFSAPAALALHESDVGVIDWYKRLIGVPLAGAVDTAPRFLHSGDDSLVLTATANNVLAALHPRNGSVGSLLDSCPPTRNSSPNCKQPGGFSSTQKIKSTHCTRMTMVLHLLSPVFRD